MEHIESQLLQATKIIEERVDSEIQRLDKLDDTELEALRQQRLEQMRQGVKQKEQWLANGHGRYYEIAEESDFFKECKRSKNLVCHFYRDSAFRCKIVDKHLAILAAKHIECKFIKMNAEKSPFLTGRLKIKVIPTIVISREEKVKDSIVGFDDLGGHDEFSTEMMEWRIAQADVISYSGDLLVPPDQKKQSTGILGFAGGSKSKVRGKGDDDSDSDNDW